MSSGFQGQLELHSENQKKKRGVQIDQLYETHHTTQNMECELLLNGSILGADEIIQLVKCTSMGSGVGSLEPM